MITNEQPKSELVLWKTIAAKNGNKLWKTIEPTSEPKLWKTLIDQLAIDLYGLGRVVPSRLLLQQLIQGFLSLFVVRFCSFSSIASLGGLAIPIKLIPIYSIGITRCAPLAVRFTDQTKSG